MYNVKFTTTLGFTLTMGYSRYKDPAGTTHAWIRFGDKCSSHWQKELGVDLLLNLVGYRCMYGSDGHPAVGGPDMGQTWGCRPMLRSGQPARRHGLEQRQSPRRQPNHLPAAARRRLPRRQCPVPSRWRPPCLPAAACQNQPRRRRPVPSRWRPCLPQAWLPAACQLQRRRQHPVPSRPQARLPAAQRRQHQLRLRRPAPSHGQVEQAALRQHPSRWRVCHVPSHPQAWLPAAQRRQRQLRLRHPAPSHWQVEQAALRHHPSRWRVCHWAPKIH